jgi:hypothetical protein
MLHNSAENTTISHPRGDFRCRTDFTPSTPLHDSCLSELLDADISSEIGEGIDQTVTRSAVAYRQTHGFLTLSVVSVMEIIQRYQRVGGSNGIQALRNATASEQSLLSDQAAADLDGQIAGDLDRVGRPIDPPRTRSS